MPAAETAAAGGRRAARRVLQATLIHRHGDRSPITPCGSETFWSGRLPSREMLGQLARKFPTAPAASCNVSEHFAAGKPPYGQLSQLGVDQLVAVGMQLRSRLGWDGVQHPASISSSGEPLLQCFSTPFSRTIQSAQALLSGLVSGAEHGSVQVNTSLGQLLLPDPSPRHPRQAALEAAFWSSESLQHAHAQRDELRERVAAELVSAGVVRHLDVFRGSDGAISWNRLAEVGNCLAAHGGGGGGSADQQLEMVLARADLQAVVEFAAWRWHTLFDNRELVRYAIGGTVLSNLALRWHIYSRNLQLALASC